MQNVSRRSILTTGASAGLILATPTWTRAQTAPTTRYSATSPQGKEMLKLYAQAVDIMMKLIPKGDPRHWDFQWYTHWIPGPQSPWPAVAAKKNETLQSIYAGKPPSDPNRRLAQLMWDDCQAHSDNPGDPAYFQEQFFLPWHRYFVYYFEQIIRSVLQNPNFSLPYWDYLGGPPASTVIPEEFRNPSSPLYRPNRNVGVNDGQPIDIGPGRTRLSAAPFRETLYINATGNIGFCPQLDGNPHGAVHVDVGNSTNMGRVPTAAGDPIFWLHHCEIDRLWESWNRLPNRRNPAWPTRSFVFANGSGGMVTAPVAGADRVALLGYEYDNYFVPPGIPTAAVASAAPVDGPERLAAAVSPVEVRGVAPPVVLGDAPVRASLALPVAPVGATVPSALRFAAPLGSRNLYLVLDGIMLHAQPGDIVYDVYIDLPEAARPTPTDPHYVGTLNFFHITVGGDHLSSHHSSMAFNVTDAVRNLQRVDSLSGQATVTLIPSGELQSGAQPMIEQIQVVES